MTDTSDEAIAATKKFLTGTGVIHAEGNLWAWDISFMLSALRDERSCLKSSLEIFKESFDKVAAERDRLRDALEKIGGITMSMCLNYKDMAETQRDIARVALGKDQT